jgi:hypothetical protein
LNGAGAYDTAIRTAGGTGISFGSGYAAPAVRIDSSGRVGIGTASPSSILEASTSVNTTGAIKITNSNSGTGANASFLAHNGTFDAGFGIGGTNYNTYAGIRPNGAFIYCNQAAGIGLTADNVNGFINFVTGGSTERARIDSSGRLLVGTSSSPSSGQGQFSLAVIQGYAGGSLGAGDFSLQRGQAATAMGSGDDIGYIKFNDNAGNTFANIAALVDATPGASDYPGRLTFSTTADGASSPTERVRISSSGELRVGADSPSGNSYVFVKVNDNTCYIADRLGSDGDLFLFRQAGTQEGSISVSGTTVSYNGAHLSRWSQIPGIDPYNKAVRPEILRGTVMSNLDEMCDWTCPESGECQDNEQLNKTKISDVEGDKNVAGIFQSWDDDDDTWVNDYYLAMTGDFVIRIAAGTTVERGDLLMSAGDGTAKPQDDDIIRSKTIAKVTSANVSCTYEDGSYCVPCVLMAC